MKWYRLSIGGREERTIIESLRSERIFKLTTFTHQKSVICQTNIVGWSSVTSTCLHSVDQLMWFEHTIQLLQVLKVERQWKHVRKTNQECASHWWKCWLDIIELLLVTCFPVDNIHSFISLLPFPLESHIWPNNFEVKDNMASLGAFTSIMFGPDQFICSNSQIILMTWTLDTKYHR